MRPTLLHAVSLATGLFLAVSADAADVGWRSLQIAGATTAMPAIPVALYYPTTATMRSVAMGPFTVRAAMSAPAPASVKGLIVLSHGTGGSELGHSSLAEALAQHGYLVAALRHPGDNWQDRTLLQKNAASYFSERPRHLSRVIDVLLSDPEWGPRIASDARGPRVGAMGMSAGGYSVLALAGGQPDTAQLIAHCTSNRTQDPIFCSLAQPAGVDQAPQAIDNPAVQLIDRRVRAVVALAPLGVIFSAQSLQRIRLPVVIYEAERDRFLVPRFHTRWLSRNMPGAEFHVVPKAWHFAFMDTPSMAITTEDGDVAADPVGFDRKALLDRLRKDLPTFFDKAFAVDR